ncbi:MAG: L-threonylcarbamoyladenylate synthase [Rhodocyclaceae bacterium]
MNRKDIAEAAALLRRGEIVAFPTETVYGLGADALNAAAVAKIFAAKERPADHPLIIHLPGNAQLEHWARDVPGAAQRLAAALWPGPLTLILKRHSRVPAIVSGGQDTVGLRVPDHPVARELLAQFGSGIAAPSANRFGRISPTTAEHVRQELGSRVPLVLDGGPCTVGIESTILDLSTPAWRILRPGAVGADEIVDILGRPLRPVEEEDESDETLPRVSGSLPGHYAPRTPLLMVPPAALLAEVAARLAQGLNFAVLGRNVSPAPGQYHGVLWQRAITDPAGYAHDLYAHLRALDAAQVDLIMVEEPPRSDAWMAVNDRLARAARGSGANEEP